MTKKELLEMIAKSTWREDPDEAKRSLYKKYYALLEASFKFCPDDFKIENFSSLKEFKKEEDFEWFIRNENCSVIEKKFDAILTDIDTFSVQYLANCSKKIKENFSSAASGYESCLQKKKRRSLVITIICGVLAVAIITVAALELFNIIDSGEVLVGIIGLLDFACGASFFIYERWDDIQSKGQQQIANEQAEENIDEIMNGNLSVKPSKTVTKQVVRVRCIKGDYNNVQNTYNASQKQEE